MAWIRQRPSGNWAATVYSPGGRITETFGLKGEADAWAGDREAEIRRGDWIDPRKARLTVAEVWRRHADARRLEKASRKRDESIWRNHVAPRWGGVELADVLKPDVQQWVNGLEDEGIGGWVIIAALNVLKSTLELAVDAGYVRHNAARRVQPPVPPEHVDRVINADEEELILSRLDELFPGRRDGRLFVEGLFETGARWEELAAVKREAVDLRHGLVRLGPVVERDGTIREYPKGARSRHSAGFRSVPIGTDYGRRLRSVVLATAPGGLVYTGPAGGVLSYTRWLARVWRPGLRAPYVGPPPPRRHRTGPVRIPPGPPLLADPQPTPHDCRHTYGTRLAEAAVPEHDRMALMGHRDQRSARRYVHSGDDRFARARAALRRSRSGSRESNGSYDLEA